MLHWLSGPWTWIGPLLIFVGIPLLAGAVVLKLRHREEVLPEPPEPEPEAPEEQTSITPATGHLIDPEVEKVIGNPLLRWGKPKRRRYFPDDYDGPISCLLCHREILPGQYFWETPLINRETGEAIGTSFQLCLACQPGDIAAVVHRGT